MNTITIELCAEDRARLDKILAALENRPSCESCVDTVTALVEAIEENEPAPAAPTEAQQEELFKPEPAPTVEYKTADIQQKVVSLSAAGKKAEVKAIIQEYAEKVSGVPADKYGEVMARLAALEG